MTTIEQDDLNLPESDFVYHAGKTSRPWAHTVGRWRAMKPPLAEILAKCAARTDKPLRVVDVGSCTGFFSLQAANAHPVADIVGVEGSVGVGNGTAGMSGQIRSILRTQAVQTYLRWIRRTGLENCFHAPEVWDYQHVCKLASSGKPICDAMFMLSVVHHIDGVSHSQYAAAGLTEVAGFIDLMAKLLLLSAHHFIELPNQPWLQPVYDTYQTQRRILDAACEASGKTWTFKGPLFRAEWFGQRELWLLTVKEGEMEPVDVRECPFPHLYRGDEQELMEHSEQSMPQDEFDGLLEQTIEAESLFALDDHYIDDEDHVISERARWGLMIDPGLLTTVAGQGGGQRASEKVGRALSSASTELLLAHLALRDAVGEAHRVLKSVQITETSNRVSGDASQDYARHHHAYNPPSRTQQSESEIGRRA